MAVGLNQREIDDLSQPELIADDPFPLPHGEVELQLIYPNKVSEEEVLLRRDTRFVQLDGAVGEPVVDIKTNALLAGDNFLAMHRLLNDFAGQVRLIYSDPPYCTGLEFQSRARKRAYSDQLSPVAYVEFIRRRLILMRELLSDDGSLYLHVGHQMMAHVKVTLDEVFGKKAFRNLIVRKKCSSKNYTHKQYPNLHDYVLYYTKSSKSVWNAPGEKPTEEWIDREYPKIDGNRRYKLVPVHAPGTRRGETGNPWRGVSPPPGKHWQFTPSKLDELDARGEIHWSRNSNPRRKVYFSDDKVRPYTDYWDSFRDAHHQSIPITGYPTEKNLQMIQMIVGASSNTGDIVLDPFCGSGTALHAADSMNRAWIGIDRSPLAIQTTVQRLRQGLEPMGDFVRTKPRPENIEMFDRTPNIVSASSFCSYADEALAEQMALVLRNNER